MEQQTSSKVQRQHMLDKELKTIDNTGFDKASARADLSYVSRQQDKFQIFSSAGKRINIKRKQLTKISRIKRNIYDLGLTLNISIVFRPHKQINNLLPKAQHALV